MDIHGYTGDVPGSGPHFQVPALAPSTPHRCVPRYAQLRRAHDLITAMLCAHPLVCSLLRTCICQCSKWESSDTDFVSGTPPEDAKFASDVGSSVGWAGMREKQRATQVEAYSMVVMIFWQRCIANGVLLGGGCQRRSTTIKTSQSLLGEMSIPLESCIDIAIMQCAFRRPRWLC